MSSGKAEFIFEGDSTQLVAQFYKLEDAIKKAKQAAKGMIGDDAALTQEAAKIVDLTNKRKSLIETMKHQGDAQKKLNEQSRQHSKEAEVYALKELDTYQLASKEIEDINRRRLIRIDEARQANLAREEATHKQQLAMTAAFARQLQALDVAAGRVQGGLAGSARGGNRFRDVMTQAAYGASDFMAVSGGLAERFRAVANNIQYAAMMIPGYWGIAINVLTLAAQAGTVLWASMTKGDETTNKHAKHVDELAEYYKKLTEETEKARVGIESFEESQRANEFLKMINPKTNRLDRIKAEMGELDTQIAPLAEDMKYYDREGLAAPKERQQLKRLQDQRESIKIEFDILSKEVKDISDLHYKNEANILQKSRDVDAGKRVAGGVGALTKIFTRDFDTIGEQGARTHLEKMVGSLLGPEFQKSVPIVAGDIAGKATADILGARLNEQLDPKAAIEKEIAANQRKIEISRIEKEEAKAEMEKKGYLSPVDEQKLKSNFDSIIDTLEAVNRKAKLKLLDEKTEEKTGIMQGPIQPLPPPVRRNGNA